MDVFPVLATSAEVQIEKVGVRFFTHESGGFFSCGIYNYLHDVRAGSTGFPVTFRHAAWKGEYRRCGGIREDVPQKWIAPTHISVTMRREGIDY